MYLLTLLYISDEVIVCVTPEKGEKQKPKNRGSSEKQKKKVVKPMPSKEVLVHTTAEDFFGSSSTKTTSMKRKKVCITYQVGFFFLHR